MLGKSFIAVAFGLLAYSASSAQADVTIAPGNVGIGTTTPTSLLHTVDTAAQTISYTGVLHTVSDTSGTASINKIGMDIESTGTWNGAGAVNTGLVVNAADGATNYAAIFNGGNVGIGTSTPQAQLHIVNTGTPASLTLESTTGNARFMLKNGSGNFYNLITIPSDNILRFQYNGSTFIAMNGVAGTMGVGSITSGAVLDVASPTATLPFFRVSNATQPPYFIVANNGNAGIGTASPQHALHVNGPLQTTSAATGQASTDGALIYYSNATNLEIANQEAGNIHISINGAERIRILGNGAVGIGTTAPGYLLEVNGAVAGVGPYNALSDRRLKKNIKPINNGLDIVEHLQGVHFQWRMPAERNVGKTFNLAVSDSQIGFIAQDLQKVLPEAVSIAKGPDAIMSVAESKIVPVLVEAIKELKAANDNQAAELRQLRAQQNAEIGALKTQISALQRVTGVRTARN